MFLNRCHEMVRRQTVKNLHHVIISGEDTIGYKLNNGIKSTSADIYIRFDDDDVYSDDYVQTCIDSLQYCDLTGLNKAYFTDGNKAWLYEYKGGQGYVIGSGSAFRRSFWEQKQYDEKAKTGEDLLFCRGKIKPHNYLQGFIAQIHNNNTASMRQLPLMQEVPLSVLPNQLLSDILASYPLPQ